MRSAQVELYTMLMLLATGCGDLTAPGATATASSIPATDSAASLRCEATQQTVAALADLGPGRATPEEAVAPYAGALTLAAHKVGERMTVQGLRTDGSVFRSST